MKLLALAKSRLAPYGDEARVELALAFADDVVTALLACGAVTRVVVVTDDARAAAALRRPGTCVAADLPGAGLDAALVHGAKVLGSGDHDHAVGTDRGLGTVAVPADLPALRPADLAAVLDGLRVRAFVADTSSVGTTLLAAPPGCPLSPSYGPGSRARHLAGGALELAAAPSLRRDVDTPADLAEALALGVGPRTARVAAGLHAPAGS